MCIHACSSSYLNMFYQIFLCFLVFAIVCSESVASDIKHLDFSRIYLIRYSEIEKLHNTSYVEKLIFLTGMNDELPQEITQEIMDHAGGLYIFQYPNQFAKYITFLKQFPIKSYLEIGCRWGGTFIFTVEYLSRFRVLERAVAVDIIPSLVTEYEAFNPISQFLQYDSRSIAFAEYIQSQPHFDVVFIDGDHSYGGVQNDFLVTRDKANILVFHDIHSNSCPEVNKFWFDFTSDDANNEVFYFFEFIDQYEEVTQRQNEVYLGIGVAIRKEYYHKHWRYQKELTIRR